MTEEEQTAEELRQLREEVSRLKLELNERETKPQILIKEVPKLENLNKYSSDSEKDMKEFLEQYEMICQNLYPNQTEKWVAELENKLSGPLKEFYASYISVGEISWEKVKPRLIKQNEIIKKSVKFKKQDDFNNAKKKRTENLQSYAYRLEALAGKDSSVNDNKLCEKFIETVADKERNKILKKKKEYENFGAVFKWDVILEMIVDDELETETKEFDVKYDSNKSDFRTFNDALLHPKRKDTYDLNYGTENKDFQERKGHEYRNQKSKQFENQEYRGRPNFRERSRSRGNYSRQRSQSRGRVPRCFNCDRLGHIARECRTKNYGPKCQVCNRFGHKTHDCWFKDNNKNENTRRNEEREITDNEENGSKSKQNESKNIKSESRRNFQNDSNSESDSEN